MELQEIERHATALMTAHGVGSVPFAFDNSRRRMGCAHFYVFNKGRTNEYHIAEKLTFSRHCAAIITDDEIREVILHEIAHLLTPGHGHDYVWRRKAREIGAKGDRCLTPTASPDKSVVATCPCGHVVSEGHRLPQSLWVHTGCGLPLTYTRNGRKVSLNQMPARYQARYAAAEKKGLFS